MHKRIQYVADSPWLIREPQFDVTTLSKFESIFALGNGYCGLRSATTEPYVGEKRNTFIAGTFNRALADEVAELPNLPDMTEIDILVNGYPLDLSVQQVISYQRQLNMRTGELTRDVTMNIGGADLVFHFSRMVSFARKHSFAEKITVENRSPAMVSLTLTSGINGQISNSGSQHLKDGTKRVLLKSTLQMETSATNRDLNFIFLCSHHLFENGKDILQNFPVQTIINRRKISQKIDYSLSSGQKIQFEKNCSLFSSIDKDVTESGHFLSDYAAITHQESNSLSYDQLLAESMLAWDKEVWVPMPVVIQSQNLNDQRALNFARYHLHIMTPGHDSRMNIGAKGLTGEGYKGHTFWDTEIFMLPYFSFSYPEVARHLETYRYLGIEGARKKASKNGYQGAQYPWEASWPSYGEETPEWGDVDVVSGMATRIWSGDIEQHITADVAFAMQQYVDITGDTDFLRDKGYQILFETAAFWASRVEWNESKHHFEICDVVGPDEYKEHVDNNAFTNYLAHWNVTTALKAYRFLEKSDAEQLVRLNNITHADRFIDQWERVSELLYLPIPNHQGVIPQDDTFLAKKEIDLTNYKNAERVGTIYHDFNMSQINQIQVSKQADVLLLLFLMEDKFNKDEKLLNWDYYEPKTLHDSSLSFATHAILAADLGKEEEAYQFFQKACAIDLSENMHSSDEGIHAAAMGGIWNAAILGFGGIRCLDGQLRIDPHLPAQWTTLEFQITWQKQIIKVSVNQDKTRVTNTGNESVVFLSKNTAHTLAPQQSLELSHIGKAAVL